MRLMSKSCYFRMPFDEQTRNKFIKTMFMLGDFL